jgi:hypothetical protein
LKILFEDAISARQSSGRHTPFSIPFFGTYGLVILDADDADLKRPLFLLQKKNYYTKLPIKQLTTEKKLKKLQQVNHAKSICFISKIKYGNALFWKREVQNKQYQN